MWKFSKAQTGARLEDDRLIRGAGRYVDDFHQSGQAHAAMLRSTAAAASFSLDIEAAKAMPGVLLVLTGDDVENAALGPVCNPIAVPNRDGSMSAIQYWPIMAHKRVRYCGEIIAAVIAETSAAAQEATEAIIVDYNNIPAVADIKAATKIDAATVHDALADNICFDWEYGDEAAVSEAFAQAAHIIRVNLVNNRVLANPIEPRAVLAYYDVDAEAWLVRTTTQGVNYMRDTIAAALRLDPAHLHVVNDDVGGGFGPRFANYPEYPLALWAAQRLNRPVRWLGSRADVFLNDTHARDHLTEAALALDAEGRFLGLHVDTMANMGAYNSIYSMVVPTLAAAGVHAGIYRLPALYNRVRGVMTHTTPVDAYRGAGRPEANYVTERLIDEAARILGFDRAELRRRNAMPTVTSHLDDNARMMSMPVDCGDFTTVIDKALAESHWHDFDQRRDASKRHGMLRGLGISCYMEKTAGGGTDSGRLVLDPAGILHVHVGTQSTGQGHETAWTKLIAERFGLEDHAVKTHSGDTRHLERGGGTGGAKSLYMVLGSLDGAADDLVTKSKQVAAQLWQVDVNDIDFAGADGDASFRSRATNQVIGLFELAREVDRQGDAMLDGNHQYFQPKASYPYGCHLCEIEIDPETGVTAILNYTVVDDFGLLINPMLVDGQVHGGIVQGLGQAMGEEIIYSEQGQLLTGSFLDYRMPRAADVPFFSISYHVSTGNNTPLGVKGCGEAGAIVATPAYVSAIRDALKDYDTEKINMPITAEKIWRLVSAA